MYFIRQTCSFFIIPDYIVQFIVINGCVSVPLVDSIIWLPYFPYWFR